jgi:ATP-dependent DNA ligase
MHEIEEGTILDGELVTLDEEGKPDFETLQLRSRSKKLVKFLFNLLHLIAFIPSKRNTSKTLHKRKS